MGLFKKFVGNIAKSVDESLEEIKNEVKKDFLQTNQAISNSEDDDRGTRMQLGSFEDGVLTIDEGITTIDEDSLKGYKRVRKVVFPSTLEEIDGNFFCEQQKYLEDVDFSKVRLLKEIPDCLFERCERLEEIDFPEGVENIGNEVYDSCTKLRKIIFPSTLKSLGSTTHKCHKIEEVDMSKVHLLEEIPDDFICDDCQIEALVIPKGVKTIGDGFATSESIKEIYLPDSVEEVGYTNEHEEKADVYLYSDKVTEIEDFCSSVDRLYVPEHLYANYEELLDDLDDTDVELRNMPKDKLYFYDSYAHDAPVQPKKEEATQVEETTSPQPVKKSPGNLFSDDLEELINSVAEGDEITDKKKEIVLRHAIKEGEDPDEVEMVLEARFFEAHNK